MSNASNQQLNNQNQEAQAQAQQQLQNQQQNTMVCVKLTIQNSVSLHSERHKYIHALLTTKNGTISFQTNAQNIQMAVSSQPQVSSVFSASQAKAIITNPMQQTVAMNRAQQMAQQQINQAQQMNQAQQQMVQNQGGQQNMNINQNSALISQLNMVIIPMLFFN